MKVIKKIPLDKLYSEDDAVSYIKERYLNTSDIRDILSIEKRKIVVANVGTSLECYQESECYNITKNEVQSHLIENHIT